MKSKAPIKGHPIHPMVVAFPIAFLYGASGFDAAGRLANWAKGYSTGSCLLETPSDREDDRRGAFRAGQIGPAMRRGPEAARIRGTTRRTGHLMPNRIIT